jgi:hypothetical protein
MCKGKNILLLSPFIFKEVGQKGNTDGVATLPSIIPQDYLCVSLEGDEWL